MGREKTITSKTHFLSIPFICCIKFKLPLKSSVGRFQSGHGLEFHMRCIKSVLSVTQLDQLFNLITHCSIVFHHHTFHSFDQSSLNVTWESPKDFSVFSKRICNFILMCSYVLLKSVEQNKLHVNVLNQFTETVNRNSLPVSAVLTAVSINPSRPPMAWK